jgi:hypothetical protein
MTDPSQSALPPLPEPRREYQGIGRIESTGYTAEQMRAYALAALAAQPQAEPVAWSLIFDDDPHLNMCTAFETEDDAKKYAKRCGAATVVPLYTQPAPQAEPSSATVPSDAAILKVFSDYGYGPEEGPEWSSVSVGDALAVGRAVLALAAPAVQEPKE